jgi:hypothetical protein
MLKKILIGLLIITVIGFTAYQIPQPSHSRTWRADQKVLPNAEVNGDDITIYNVRNNHYTSVTKFDEQYETRNYNLKDLTKLWFIVVPFGDNDAIAHTFFSFQFGEDQFLSVSVEARHEKGEKYSPIKGIFKQYELMYVLADERDSIGWRANQHKLDAYVYPIKTETTFVRALFIDILTSVNEIYNEPQFYNTITNACNVALFNHMNNIRSEDIAWSSEVILPGYADKLVYEHGFIDTDLPYEDIRQYFNVKEVSQLYDGEEDYSLKIREHF